MLEVQPAGTAYVRARQRNRCPSTRPQRMAAPAAASYPNTAFELPSKVAVSQAPKPSPSRYPTAPAGTIASQPTG
eukprot:11184156-Lingulodinium_polyedra.AAC.1